MGEGEQVRAAAARQGRHVRSGACRRQGTGTGGDGGGGGGLTLLAWACSMGAAALRVCTTTLARTAGGGCGGASA